MSPDEKEKIRDIPTSLRGIRSILLALFQDNNSLLSIRQISVSANISIRVAKNILLELEKLKQVERITDPNQILPKWRLTKLGKDVASALGSESAPHDSKKSHIDYLLSHITIPSKNDELNSEIAVHHSGILTGLNNLQINLSKVLGLCYNLDHPVCAEYIGKLISKLTQLKNEMSALIVNPLGIGSVHKLGSAERKIIKVTKEQLAERDFSNQLILSQVTYCAELEYRLRSILETGERDSFHVHFSPLVYHFRVLSYLIDKRKLLDSGIHILNDESLKQISANLISVSIVEQFLPQTLPFSQIQSQLKEEVIHLISATINHENANLSNEEKQKFYPLISFYQMVKDRVPYTDFSIDSIEIILDELSEKGYIPGLKVINPGTSESYKIVQLLSHDLSKDELYLIQFAVKARQFTLSEVINELHWERIKTEQLLNALTNNGILRHSSSYLHGDKWYVISE